jgi:hypothetical protein
MSDSKTGPCTEVRDSRAIGASAGFDMLRLGRCYGQMLGLAKSAGGR